MARPVRDLEALPADAGLIERGGEGLAGRLPGVRIGGQQPGAQLGEVLGQQRRGARERALGDEHRLGVEVLGVVVQELGDLGVDVLI